MCHVSEISAANRPFTPPHPWFRRTGGGQPRPMVWAGGRTRHSVLGREAARMRHEIPVIPKEAPQNGGPKRGPFVPSHRIL